MTEKPRERQEDVVWFSRFFGIDLPQYELPFVDFSLNSDVPLYIDPYAITKDPTDFAGRCHNAVFSYFQLLLEVIRTGSRTELRRLVRGRLAEPTEIHLGVSQVARGGRGLGTEQEQQVVDALAESEAARVGVIQAIQELELHIPGIGPDKISDLVANIILGYLAQYTERICQLYGIPTRACAVSTFWNEKQQEWDGGYFNLPVRDTHSYILVPKRFVRRERDLMNHAKFYNKYVLEVLQRELLDAGDSLVKTLKNGRRIVTKKDIREDGRFPGSKDFISQFIMEHPDTIEAYRDDLLDSFAPTDPAIWSGKDVEDDPLVQGYLEELEALLPGRPDADTYHQVIFELVRFIFDYALENFDFEVAMDGGRSRIDIVADNFAGEGLFKQLRDGYDAWSVPMECKNYSTDLGNTEFNQLMERLSPTTSRFGMLFCRGILNSEAMVKHQGDRWLRHGCIILLVDDRLVRELVALRLIRDFEAIESRLRALIRTVRFGGQPH